MARNLVRFDPFAELNTIQRRFFEDGAFPLLQGIQRPTTDVYTEDDNKLVIESQLPQFDQNDITVDIDQGALVVQAERHEKTEEKKKKYVMRESSSSFYRRIALPEQADEDKIHARFSKGVLTVTVPFKEMPAPKKIAITAESTKPE